MYLYIFFQCYILKTRPSTMPIWTRLLVEAPYPNMQQRPGWTTSIQMWACKCCIQRVMSVASHQRFWENRKSRRKVYPNQFKLTHTSMGLSGFNAVPPYWVASIDLNSRRKVDHIVVCSSRWNKSWTGFASLYFWCVLLWNARVTISFKY